MKNDDVLERATKHLKTMAPHVRERLTAQLLAEICKELERVRDESLRANDIRYLISRLERIKELVESGNKQMAIAKLLADITALRLILRRNKMTTDVERFVMPDDLRMNALQEIIDTQGMRIYGTADYFDAPDDVKNAFRDGSAKAYNECAILAREFKPVFDEAISILTQIKEQYDAKPDGDLGKGFVNEPFLRAKRFLISLDT